jgi:hypothetical protein
VGTAAGHELKPGEVGLLAVHLSESAEHIDTLLSVFDVDARHVSSSGAVCCSAGYLDT